MSESEYLVPLLHPSWSWMAIRIAIGITGTWHLATGYDNRQEQLGRNAVSGHAGTALTDGKARGGRMRKGLHPGPMDIGARHWNAVFGSMPRRMQSRAADFNVDGRGVKVFVYNMHSQYARDAYAWAETFREEKGSNCDFMLTPCTENGWNGKYTTMRQWGTEVLILQKIFAASAFDVLTDDPTVADLFVVPYLASLACRMQGWAGHSCFNSPADTMTLIERLPHYSSATAHRHLFISTNDAHSAPLIVQMQPLLVTIGPKMEGSRVVIAPPAVEYCFFA